METANTFAEYFNAMNTLREEEDIKKIELMQAHHKNELVSWNDLESALGQLAEVVAIQRVELQTEMNVKLSATVQTLVEKRVISEDVAEQIMDMYNEIDKQMEDANSEQEDS